MDSKNFEVIKAWPIPQNICKKLRSFIGMCAYFRCFFEKFSFIAGSLHDLKKKNVKYTCSKKQNDAFEKLISQPRLVLSDLTK